MGYLTGFTCLENLPYLHRISGFFSLHVSLKYSDELGYPYETNFLSATMCCDRLTNGGS